MRQTLCQLVVAAAFAVSPVTAFAAAPAPTPAKGESVMDTARKALDEVGDMSYQNKSLNDLVADLKDRVKLSITLDPTIAQFGLDPSTPALDVNLKGVKLRDGLRQALAPLNLKCGLTKDGLFISTEEGLTVKQLRQRVNVDCDGTAFAAAVKALAADTGANIVIDPRLKEKANAGVTLKLEDVPLESAVRLMAEVADLGVVRMSNVLFMTTPERAEKLRPTADAPTQPNANPAFPFPAGGGIGVPGIGGIIGGAVPAPAVPVEAPKVDPVPEKKP